MQKILVTLICLLFALTTNAQYTAKIYKNFFEYRQNNYMQHEVVVEKRSKKELRQKGGVSYKVYSKTDAKLSERIQNEYQLVVIGDTVLVNCMMIKSTGFGVAYYKSPEHMYFSGPYSNIDAGYVAAGVMGGAAGAIIYSAASSTSASAYEYAINLYNEKVYPVNKQFVKDIIGKKSDLYKQYKREQYYEERDVKMKYIIQHYKDKK